MWGCVVSFFQADGMTSDAKNKMENEMNTKISVGDKVQIKEGFLKGEWGIVRHIDEFYHVAHANDANTTQVFERNEIRKINTQK